MAQRKVEDFGRDSEPSSSVVFGGVGELWLSSRPRSHNHPLTVSPSSGRCCFSALSSSTRERRLLGYVATRRGGGVAIAEARGRKSLTD